MVTFLLGIAGLLIGYFVYSKFVERVFEPDPKRITPAVALRDNMDFVPMPRWKNAIIQLLNIAGTGPIFGPIMGALYGPIAYVWIVIGCVFGGAVHDYMTGMISLRNKGAHLPELSHKYLGQKTKHIVNIFAMLLLMLVATVFVVSPASLILELLPFDISLRLIIFLIFVYYLISTILPIDKAMGKVYPWFGAILILSSIAIGFRLLTGGFDLPELTAGAFTNMHPDGMAIFPGLFFTISCGAISGFHATQSPLVARTLVNEKQGRNVFYGMMIGEGVIAMIWLAASLALFDGVDLSAKIAAGTPSVIVNEVSLLLLGQTLGFLAIIGVIVLPLSSGVSAFRSLRVILADYLNIRQDTLKKVVMVTIPLYIVSFILTNVDFNILWRYFNWANQVTAVISLLVATRYLYLKHKNYWITLIPAVFILLMVSLYILSEPIGLGMGVTPVSTGLSFLLTGVITVLFQKSGIQMRDEDSITEEVLKAS